MKELDSSQLVALVRIAKKPSLVLFYGNWCGDCAQFKPTWQGWTTGKEGMVFAMEISRGAPEWDDWNIEEIPTVAAYVEGIEIGRAHGTISADDLDRLWLLIKV